MIQETNLELDHSEEYFSVVYKMFNTVADGVQIAVELFLSIFFLSLFLIGRMYIYYFIDSNTFN